MRALFLAAPDSADPMADTFHFFAFPNPQTESEEGRPSQDLEQDLSGQPEAANAAPYHHPDDIDLSTAGLVDEALILL